MASLMSHTRPHFEGLTVQRRPRHVKAGASNDSWVRLEKEAFRSGKILGG